MSESISHQDQSINFMNMLSIGSLNLHGHAADRLSYVEKVMDTHDILMIQEYWLHDSQIDKLQSNNVCVHGISGMDSDKLLTKRPFGGVAIIWRKNLEWTVTPTKIDSRRLCGATINISGYKMLLLSVYMPVDDGYSKNLMIPLTLSPEHS